MNLKNKEWALDKVKKCLALFSKSTGNEAATALRQAKALMEKYGLTSLDLDLSDIKQSSLAVGKGTKNPPQWLAKLASCCAYAFSCRCMFYNKLESNGYAKQVSFIGVACNAELAGYVFDVLKRQLNKDRKNYKKTFSPLCHLTTRRKRADLFADNWVKAVKRIVNEFVQVDQSHLDLVNQYIENHYETNEINYPTKTKDKRYDHARLAGFVAGSHAKLHTAIHSSQSNQAKLTKAYI